jgi:hypothetical protein
MALSGRATLVGLESEAHLIEVLPQNARSLKLILADGKLDEADLAVLVPLIYDVVGGENAAQLAKAETRSRPHSLDLIIREEAHESDRVQSELEFYRHRPAATVPTLATPSRAARTHAVHLRA